MPTRKDDLLGRLLSYVGTGLLGVLVYLAVEMRVNIQKLSDALPLVVARVDVAENTGRNHLSRLDAQNTRIARIEELFIRRPTQ